MSGDLVIITPEFAPGSGGVGDYTQRVLEQWPAIKPRFLVSCDARSADSSRVQQLDREARAIRELPPDAKVLLQYSAYGFDRFGCPRALLRALADWRRRSRGQLVIMFHEIWTFWPLFNKNYPVQWLHRRAIAQVLAAADRVFTSTASQAAHLHDLCRRCDVQVLPVGSNIRPVAARDSVNDGGAAVLFGLQGSRVAALQRMHADLQRLAELACITKLVSVGGGSTPDGAARERELATALPLRDGAEMLGALPEDQISAVLAASAFGVSAQDELSVTKSGSFMAYAAHGLNILSPHGGGDREEPLRWATHPDELARGLSPDELRSRGEALQSWQERTCSWPRIADRFAAALQLPVGKHAEPAGL